MVLIEQDIDDLSKKPEYPERTTERGQVTDKPYYMRCEFNGNRFVWYKPAV